MNQFFKSLTAGTLILTIVVVMALVPIHRAKAQWTVVVLGDTVFFAKEYVLDTLVVVIAKVVIQKITASTVNWILSGYDGNPTFIEDPGSVFNDLGDSVADDFLTRLVNSDNANAAGLGKALCSPFSLKVRAAIAFNFYAGTNPTDATKCTLEQVVKNVDNFLAGDFLEGGWDGFYATAVKGDNPNDQFFKFSLALQSEVAGEKETLKQELTQGSGFMSIKDCRGKSVNVNDAGQRAMTAEELALGIGDNTSSSKQNCKISTPGSYIAESLPQITGSALRQAELADELNQAVASIAVALIQQTLGGVGGLSGAGKSPSGGKSIVQQYAEDDPGSTSLVSLRTNTIRLYNEYKATEEKHLVAAEDMLSAAKAAENALLRAIKCPDPRFALSDAQLILDRDVTPVVNEFTPKVVLIKEHIVLLEELVTQVSVAKDSKEISATIYEEDGTTLRYQPTNQEEALVDQQKRDDVVNKMNTIRERAEAGAGSCSI